MSEFSFLYLNFKYLWAQVMMQIKNKPNYQSNSLLPHKLLIVKDINKVINGISELFFC